MEKMNIFGNAESSEVEKRSDTKFDPDNMTHFLIIVIL